MIPADLPPTPDGAPNPGPGLPRRQPPRVPSRRERFRPLELLSLSGVVALFVGLIVLMSTRELDFAVISAGLIFIIALVGFAMMALAVKPTGDERADLDEQNRGTGH